MQRTTNKFISKTNLKHKGWVASTQVFNVASVSWESKASTNTDGTLFIPSVSGKSYTKNKQCLIIKIMNIIEKLLGEGYPKLGSEVFADGNKTVVTVSRTLSPDHVDLDAPSYVETKFKKHIPVLRSIDVELDAVTEEQTIKVTVEVDGKFNSIDDLRHLAFIARGISEVAEDKLSEPNAIKAIGLDCKPFICTDDESEETQANA